MLTIEEIKETGLKDPIRVIHTICGGIVFWYDGIERGQYIIVNPDKVRLLNGASPRVGDPILCPNCDYIVYPNQLEWLRKEITN
jgi:hypothetical protein